jgi:hypothetical protein
MEIDIVKETASRMADIVEATLRYIGGEPFVTNEGLAALGETFEKVPLELRAATFEGLLVELQKRDVDYDVSQFVQDA